MGSMKRPAPTKTSASSAMPTPKGKQAGSAFSQQEASSFSARACLRLPHASASLGQSAAWAALAFPPHFTWGRADKEGLLLLVARFDLDELLAHGRLDARGVAVEDAVDPPD
eukprot:scaffold30328_cov48-Phaeocystis_antarctica.AAC.1